MQCPVCKPHQTLRVITLVDGLTGRVCPSCEGHWLRGADYRTWRGRLAEAIPNRTVESSAETAELRGLKRCPEDQRILARLRITPDVPFTFDYCRGCEGMWFDPGEWNALLQHNLHDDLLQMVFDDWQRDVEAGSRKNAETQQFRQLLGEADFERVVDFRTWLQNHPHRSAVLELLSQPGSPAE